MLKIKYQILENNLGLGLYTNEFLKRGQIIATFHKNYVKQFSVYDILYADPHVHQFLMDRAYKDRWNGNYYIALDGLQFINHSNRPNCLDCRDGNTYALKDIEVGEELTVDYNCFEKYPDSSNVLFKLCKEYGKDLDYRHPIHGLIDFFLYKW